MDQRSERHRTTLGALDYKPKFEVEELRLGFQSLPAGSTVRVPIIDVDEDVNARSNELQEAQRAHVAHRGASDLEGDAAPGVTANLRRALGVGIGFPPRPASVFRGEIGEARLTALVQGTRTTRRSDQVTTNTTCSKVASLVPEIGVRMAEAEQESTSWGWELVT